MRKTVTTAQVKTTEQFCTSNATVAAFSLPVLTTSDGEDMMMMMVIPPVNEVANPGTKYENGNGTDKTVQGHQLKAVRLRWPMWLSAA